LRALTRHPTQHHVIFPALSCWSVDYEFNLHLAEKVQGQGRSNRDVLQIYSVQEVSGQYLHEELLVSINQKVALTLWKKEQSPMLQKEERDFPSK